MKTSLEELRRLEAYYAKLFDECFQSKRLGLLKMWGERLELLRRQIERLEKKQ